ncbi:MAG: dienelactone hydrolase family protein [Kiritimatiellaeota bacterium]|nr:dienelactone hydrolase family protein [Kiritimatiellota bacterium]
MFRDVVTPDMTAEDWPELRRKVYKRVMRSMGTAPDIKIAPWYEIIEEYENYGLHHLKIRYRVLPEENGLAVIVLPKKVNKTHPVPAVLCCHGSDVKNGKYNVLSTEHKGLAYRAYAIDLAERGFVTVSADLYGFGELLTQGDKNSAANIDHRYEESAKNFYKNNPCWSLNGRMVWDHQRLLDVLQTIDYIRPEKFGIIGTSLGGLTAYYVSALDERVFASVPIMGFDTAIIRAYYDVSVKLQPQIRAHCLKNHGEIPCDVQDMIALNAPRPLFNIDSYNDHCNYYFSAIFQCCAKGQHVYKLLGKPECFCTLMHGDGHGMLDDTREYAYRWLERWLK